MAYPMFNSSTNRTTFGQSTSLPSSPVVIPRRETQAAQLDLENDKVAAPQSSLYPTFDEVEKKFELLSVQSEVTTVYTSEAPLPTITAPPPVSPPYLPPAYRGRGASFHGTEAGKDVPLMPPPLPPKEFTPPALLPQRSMSGLRPQSGSFLQGQAAVSLPGSPTAFHPAATLPASPSPSMQSDNHFQPGGQAALQPSISPVAARKDIKKMPVHQFKAKLASTSLFCVHCAETIVPLAHRTYKCEVCKKVAHDKCRDLAGPCYGSDRTRPTTGHYHAFVVATYKQPTVCQHCDKLLYGLAKQGDKCIECGFNVHHECRTLDLPAHCYGPSPDGRLALNIDCPGLAKRKEGYRAHYPIVLIPGLCSSGLVVKHSETRPSWVGTRVWFSVNKLGGNMFKNIGSISDQPEGECDGTLAAALAAQRNPWLQHMALNNDADPPGITVRPMEGVVAIDFLEPGAVTGAASWVFGPLIESLRFVGYTDQNLVAAPYDWRCSMQTLERRDQYFSRLLLLVEHTSVANGTPVVLLAHSMGNPVTKYFLHFAELVKGRRWIDDHVHAFLAAGAPFLGAHKAARSTASGDNMGLGTFINGAESLMLCRSMGSASILWPVGPLADVPFHYVKKEGMLSVRLLKANVFGAEAKGQLLVNMSLAGSRRVESEPTEVVAGVAEFTEIFQFPTSDPDCITDKDVLDVRIHVRHWGGFTTNAGEAHAAMDVVLKGGARDGYAQFSVSKETKNGPIKVDLVVSVLFEPFTLASPYVQTIKSTEYQVMEQGSFLNYCGAGNCWNFGQSMICSDPFTVRYDVPPPVKNLKVVYGINLKTEVAYGWRIDTSVKNMHMYMRYKLDRKIELENHSSADGIIYETKETPQFNRDMGLAVTCSGDGTVCYQSLNYPAVWKEIPGLNVTIEEHVGMGHREMLGDPVFHNSVIDYCCVQLVSRKDSKVAGRMTSLRSVR